jgi:hypothetical protein
MSCTDAVIFTSLHFTSLHFQSLHLDFRILNLSENNFVKYSEILRHIIIIIIITTTTTTAPTMTMAIGIKLFDISKRLKNNSINKENNNRRILFSMM